MADAKHDGWESLRNFDAWGRTARWNRTLVNRWTREIQRAPTPRLDAALAAHTAAIERMHRELGLEAPVLP